MLDTKPKADRGPGLSASAETIDGEAGLGSDEIRHRAVRGAAMLAGRGVAVQFIGFLTNLVLARLLAPQYFGITTLGLTVVSAANILADAGVGASLIARREPPTRAELGAVTGLQLSITTLFSLIAIPVGFALGGNGPATAIILLALPLYSLRTPPLLLFERQLEFAPRVLVQVVELVTYGVVAIALALLGVGVWAMPVALVVRTGAGTILARFLSPIRGLRPNLRISVLKPILGFGVRFQVRTIAQLIRDIILVSLIGSMAGLQGLGYYGFCSRLLSVPQLLATSLGEVTLPAFSRLIGRDDDVNPLLKRSTTTVATISALLIGTLTAGSAGLVPFLFGHQWKDASLILPGSALSLIIAGPLGVTVVGYLYAKGDAKTPLWANITNGVLTIVFTVLSYLQFGLIGIGIGPAIGALVATPQMLLGVRRRGGPELWTSFLGPAIIGSIGITLGWWLCASLGDTLMGALAGMAAAFTVQVALGWFTNRSALLTSYQMLRRALSVMQARKRPGAAGVAPTAGGAGA